MFVKPEHVYDMHAVSQKLLKGNMYRLEATAELFLLPVSRLFYFVMLDRKLQRGGCTLQKQLGCFNRRVVT